MKTKNKPTEIDVNDEILGVAEAALFCKVSESAMYKRVQRGLAPSHRIGKRLYFSKRELIEYTFNG